MQQRIKTLKIIVNALALRGLFAVYARAADPAAGTLPDKTDYATTIAVRLDGITRDITVHAFGSKTLVVCADPATTAELKMP